MVGVSATSAGQVKLGEFSVNRIGLGTNRIADNDQSRTILKHALKHDVNFIDTAKLYGQSQEIIGQTLAPYPSSVIISTKGGFDTNRVDVLESSISQSLKLLKLDKLPHWFLHRPRDDNPFEDTIRFLKGQIEAGRIAHVGLSEVSVEQIEAARKIMPISAVQNHYNLETRQHEAVVDYCTRENIVFMPFYPLSSGGAADNSKLVQMADKYSATPIQIAIAWLLKRSPMMLAIPGTLNPDHLDENLAAAKIELSDDDYSAL